MRCAEQTKADVFFEEREHVYKKFLNYVSSKTTNENFKETYSEIHIQLGEIYREGKVVNRPSLSERPKKYLEKWSKLLKDKEIGFEKKEVALHYFEIIFNELVLLSAARLLSANLYYDVSSARCYAGANKVAKCLIEQVKANDCEDDFFNYFFEKFKVIYKIHCEDSSQEYVSHHEFVCRMLFQAPAFYVWLTNYVWSQNKLTSLSTNEINLLIELHLTVITSGFNPRWYKESSGQILKPLEVCFKYLEPNTFGELWLAAKTSKSSNLKTLVHLFSAPVLNPILLTKESLEDENSYLGDSEEEELFVVEFGTRKRGFSYLSPKNIELVEYINQLLRFDEDVTSFASRDVLRRYHNRNFKSVSYLSLSDYELIVEVFYKYRDEKGISELIDVTSLLSMNFINKLPKLRSLFSKGKLSAEGDLSFHLWILPELIDGSIRCLADFRTNDCWHLSESFMQSWHPDGVRLCDLNENLVYLNFMLAEVGEFSSKCFYFCEVLFKSNLISEADFKRAKRDYKWDLDEFGVPL